MKQKILFIVVVIGAVLAFVALNSQMREWSKGLQSAVENHPMVLKMTSNNEYGIRDEDLTAINESGYDEHTKKILIKVAQDVRDISSNSLNEEWIKANAPSISLHLACAVLAEYEQNNQVVKVFKVFVNTNERMTANQAFWVAYDKDHGSKPYPSKTECDALKL